MERKFYQACYGRPDTGWSAVQLSEGMPKSMLEDFTAMERGNAAMAGGEPLQPNGASSCMAELYCRNNVLGLVRVQYRLSDLEGRPVSFAHGYLFPDAYERLKDPDAVLRVRKGNFADQRVPREEQETLRSRPGALSRALIQCASEIPEELSLGEPYTPEGALRRCGMDARTYRIWIKAVYAQILASNVRKNLYVKTDGTDEYMFHLLYLTYIALPYSLRPLLSASACLYKEQRNAGLLFCAVPPEGAVWIDPATGENTVLTGPMEERLEKRNPVISAAVGYVLAGTEKTCFDAMEDWLRKAGDARLSSMQAVDLAYSLFKGKPPERQPVLLYQWLSLPVSNTKSWEETAVCLLRAARENGAVLNADVRAMLASRAKNAAADEFADEVGRYLKEIEGAGV